MNKYDLIWIKTTNWFGKHWSCHRLPERSFFFKGYQFPICARCTGILVGWLIAPLIFFLLPKLDFFYCLLLFIPLIIDGCTQLFTKYESKKYRRFFTGIMFGFAFIYSIIYVICFLINLI